jgi:hypothetical protein
MRRTRTVGFLLFALCSAAQNVAAEERPPPAPNPQAICYEVGDPVPGGICAGTGEGALIVAQHASRVTMEWDGRRWSKEEGFTSPEGKVGATDLADGRKNKPALLVAKSAAARYCDGLRLGGYRDWYLPARDELLTLFAHRKKIGGFAATPYWSSSEFNTHSAWMVDFTSGIGFIYSKETKRPVRCVRRSAAVRRLDLGAVGF